MKNGPTARHRRSENVFWRLSTYPNTLEAFICDETAETRLQQDEFKSQVKPLSFCSEIVRWSGDLSRIIWIGQPVTI
jgi:hypothetical protein